MTFGIGDPVVIRDINVIRQCAYGCNRTMELMAGRHDVIKYCKMGRKGEAYYLQSAPEWMWSVDCLMLDQSSDYGDGSDSHFEDLI